MKILILGQNPSKDNTDPDIPFEGTRSGKILDKWLQDILGDNGCEIMNCSDNQDFKFTSDNVKFLATKIGYVANKFDKIVALGKKADAILKLAGVDHFTLPHPSGRNRLLNDKRFVEDMLTECFLYIHDRPPLFGD